MQNYELGEIIESGGMGAVYKGRHTALERDVAIKFILPHVAGDEAAVDRFLREARLAARINHPNVVHVYDTGVDQQGQPYIVMELLNGESLKERLARGPMTESDAVEIGKQVLMALEKAHSMEVVHRDIKPANIYLCHDRSVKILDFGVAKGLDAGSTGNVTVAGKTVGSPAYMSPEQAEGIPVDSRTDLYSVGIVLYEILTGYTPFRGENSLAIMQKHLNSPPPPLPKEVNSGLKAVIEKALAKKVEKRYSNAREMREALEKVQGKNVIVAKSETGEGAANPTPSPGRKSTKSHETASVAKKSPVAAILIAVAAVAVIGGVLIVPKMLGGGGQSTTGGENSSSSAATDTGSATSETNSVPDPQPSPSSTDSSVGQPFVTTETKEEGIPFQTKEEDDPTLEVGKTTVKVEGQDGKQTVTYKVTYDKEGGTEISREKDGEPVVTVPPVDKIILVGKKAGTSPQPNVGKTGTFPETKTESIAFKREITQSSDMPKGKRKVTQRGRAGSREVTYQVTYENGKETNREKISSNVVREPVSEKVIVGTGSTKKTPELRPWTCSNGHPLVHMDKYSNNCTECGRRRPR